MSIRIAITKRGTQRTPNVKLKNPRKAPPNGGWFVFIENPTTGEAIRIPEKNSAVSVDRLVQLVAASRRAMGLPKIETEKLKAEVEDDICARIGAEFCWSTGSGDVLHKAILAGTKLVDAVAKTSLTKKAKGCSGCSRRRKKMNKVL